MGYVLLGHGILDLDPTVTPPDMEIVAVGPNRTIQFSSDTGQSLWYGAAELDGWGQAQAPWPPLDSSNVTYNFALHSAPEEWPEVLVNDPHFGGHQLIRPGIGDLPDPLLMCTGTRATCPTDPRQVAEGAVHHCEGVLGREDLQGDLFWLACTAIETDAEETASYHPELGAVVDAVLDGRLTDVPLGGEPDWPRASDQEAIARVNRANVERAYSGQSMPFRLAGSALFLGLGHDTEHTEYARIQEGSVRGGLTVHHEHADVPYPVARFEVHRCPAGKEELIRRALARVRPDYEVVFTS
ncbi:hypothetical protein [Streptomyces sp. WAC06614]|uniref:hypothetical protein n=1 Tax=Streptomyces sp. WAC06614 TaxID=2487416 RepID=UPI000F76BF1D|nr:hypothetical protein [Streptomyces sp. WAC06614]RSS80784.1 hypothetical protein EF918_12455 [Streptomyces sp. WAC06614]